jgi:PAS domain S-box-containing protein
VFHGFIALLQDVTERRRSEKALREREAELSRLLEAIPDVICRFDSQMRFLYASPAVERITGYPASHFVGKTHVEAGLSEALSEALRASLRRIFDSQQPDTIEFEYESPALGMRHLTGLGIPELDANGSAETVLCIIRDISDRKQGERERANLLHLEKEARQTAELLNRVGPMLAAELDLQRLVQSVTDIATQLTGAEFGSFFHNVVNSKGESYMLYSLSGVPKDAFEQFPMPRNTAVFAPTFHGEGVVRSGDITKDPRYGLTAPHHGMPKGHLPVCSYLAVPVVSRSGQVLGGLFFGHSAPDRFTEHHEAIITGIAAQASIAMDIARLFEQSLRIQEELKRSNLELRRANDDLETFAYSASHDLQEPLRMIAISAQLLDRSAGNLNPDGKHFLEGILDGARRMQTLIQDLLAYTRATRQTEGPVGFVNPAQVLQNVLENLKPATERTGARVEASPLPRVAIQEVHLTQLFQNLIGNALKYRSTEVPHVNVSAEERDGWIEFAVSDNGIGIDVRFREQIFGLFKRLHTREQYPGSGIGLAICQRILELYGGRIWLDESSPGRGSVFKFTLPADPRQ